MGGNSAESRGGGRGDAQEGAEPEAVRSLPRPGLTSSSACRHVPSPRNGATMSSVTGNLSGIRVQRRITLGLMPLRYWYPKKLSSAQCSATYSGGKGGVRGVRTLPGPHQGPRGLGPRPATEEGTPQRNMNPRPPPRGPGRRSPKCRQRARSPNAPLLPQVRPLLPPNLPDVGSCFQDQFLPPETAGLPEFR